MKSATMTTLMLILGTYFRSPLLSAKSIARVLVVLLVPGGILLGAYQWWRFHRNKMARLASIRMGD